jgi:hypothetical protein
VETRGWTAVISCENKLCCIEQNNTINKAILRYIFLFMKSGQFQQFLKAVINLLRLFSNKKDITALSDTVRIAPTSLFGRIHFYE